MKNRTLTIISALFLAISPIFASNSSVSANTPDTYVSKDYCGVSADQIYSYMQSNGITVTSIIPITGSCNVYTKSLDNKLYIVYIQDGCIFGHEEAQM